MFLKYKRGANTEVRAAFVFVVNFYFVSTTKPFKSIFFLDSPT